MFKLLFWFFEIIINRPSENVFFLAAFWAIWIWPIILEMIKLSSNFHNHMEQFLSYPEIIVILRDRFQTKLALAKNRWFLRYSAVTKDINIPSFLIINVIVGSINNLDFFKAVPSSRVINSLELWVASF